MSEQKSQEFIDRDQMITGIDLGRVLINTAMMNPQNVNKEEMMGQLQSLMTPTRFKDLFPTDLRKMVFNKYVENASIKMMTNINNNTYDVEILPQHASVADELVKHWTEKGFKVETTCGAQKYSNRIAFIHLTW